MGDSSSQQRPLPLASSLLGHPQHQPCLGNARSEGQTRGTGSSRQSSRTCLSRKKQGTPRKPAPTRPTQRTKDSKRQFREKRMNG